MGSDFVNFDAGCHGSVPLETTACFEDARYSFEDLQPVQRRSKKGCRAATKEQEPAGTRIPVMR